MPLTASAILARPLFDQIAREYRRRWGIDLVLADGEGNILAGRVRGAPIAGPRGAEFRDAVRLAIEEALRWGDPAIESGPATDGGNLVLYAAPLMHNAQLIGGLVAGITEKRLFPAGGIISSVDVKAAAAELLRIAEEHNLTNAALLAARRTEYQREQQRAEAIHAFKLDSGYKLRAAYLLDEPALVAAIRQADRGEARAIVNRLLVRMIHHAGGRLELAKSFFLELVVTLARTAVEAGGAPEELLGANFASMAQLAHIKDDETLAAWLHSMLERVMDSIQRTRTKHPETVVAAAWKHIQAHCTQDLSRDEAAEAAGVSPAHFSRLLRAHLGVSFTDLMNQARVAKAAELLVHSSKPLKLIALEAGFKDQSYFTKVFVRYMRRTPKEYRRGSS